MEAIEPDKPNQELEEWERHYLEHKDLTLDEKRQNQFNDLVDTLESLNDHFETVFLIALRNTEGEKLAESEVQQLRQVDPSRDLVKRIRGLKKVFGSAYYTALERVVGTEAINIKEYTEGSTQETETKIEKEVDEVATSATGQRVPRGFARWDLKQIKLHESLPDKGKRSWVEYWSLRGDTGVGEVLFNPARDMYYFRPFDTANKSTFPLTEIRGRKASREGRNFYFKKTVAPAGAN